jgi:hypothetical protein
MDLANRGPLGPRKPKPERGTARAKAHLARVKALPCVVCHRPGPSDAHHVISGRYGSRKASDFETIPLCKDCHQGPHGIHSAKASWISVNGNDFDFLPVVADMLAGQFNW